MKSFKLLSAAILSIVLLGCAQKETHVAVSSVSLNTVTIEMVEGETYNLVATVLPKDAEYDDLLWASSNVSVASVKSGTVTALKEGTATITVSAGGKSSTCRVTVSSEEVFVTSITLDKTSLSLKVGDSERLTATVAPSDASVRNVIWDSSNPDVVSVSSGIVTALKEGMATITASAGGKSSTCNVTVSSKIVEVTSITLDKTSLSLQVGDSETLTATVVPYDASDKSVAWASSDESIATVTDGKVTALKSGSVIVTAKAGSCTAECSVNINGHVESITLDRQTLSLTVGETAELVVDVKPLGIANVVWDSSNSSVASVNNGVVKAVSEGVAVIKAQVGDKSAECTVNVTENGKKNYFFLCTSYGTNAVSLKVYAGQNTVNLSSDGPNIEYSYDGTTWKNWKEIGYDWLILHSDSRLYLRGTEGVSNDNRRCQFFFKSDDPNVICNGSINVLYYYLSDIDEVKTKYAFNGLFRNAKALISAPDLPFKAVSEGCYYDMFRGCVSLIAAPELPAVKLSVFCYANMFESCKSLKFAPKRLPAESLHLGCYQSMFSECDITEAPEICAASMAVGCCERMFYKCHLLVKVQPTLPALQLANACYKNMFSYCTSLEFAPSLPSTSAPSDCYKEMFLGCKSLIKAPYLSAMVLDDGCYATMFKDCISLKEVQETLPATVFDSYSCYEMFSGCTSLVKAPKIVATTVGKSCCQSMFYGCTAMTEVPEILPAMRLANECYRGMFSGCCSITKAPILPATLGSDDCYSYMFEGCSKLNYIKCMLTSFTQIATRYTNGWTKGVSLYGVFVKNRKNPTSYGSNYIPPEWTVVEADE